MAQVNPLTREVMVKLVYYGPGLGGKTTSLSHVHQSAPAETRGELVSLATPVDRTLYFDFLPVRLQPVRGHRVRLQLFTVPGQVYFDATRKLVLTGADGVMFVADSQRARRDANVESLENLTTNLEEHGRTLDDMPHALSLNKRDLPDIMSEEELTRDLDTRDAPVHATVATEGVGVVAALDSLVRLALEDLDRRGIFGVSGEPLPDVRLSRADAGLDEQVGRATERMWRSSFPGSSRPEAGVSFANLFAGATEDARRVEHDLATARHAEAIAGAERLIRLVLEDVTEQAGLVGASDEVLVMLLGMEGARWLSLRKLFRRARDGGPLSDRDAMEAYATAVELRLRCDRM